MTSVLDESRKAVLRAALYERVSTDEQAKYGYSIETQIDDLTQYCKSNHIKIVDHYTDEGISGAKSPLKRPQLHRLLEDVKAGKIDIVLFTKLDRWFRSVPEYYKVQDILESHNVSWKTIYEDYDSKTANGQLLINIYLSLAQNERDKGSERVNAVLEHKRKNKEACFGGKYAPLGYKKEKIDGVFRLVKDPETQPMMEEFWDILVKYNNAFKAATYINEHYGLQRTQKSWWDTIHTEFYCGRYKGIEDFCEPYVSYEAWKVINENKTIKKTQNKRVYLFSGLIKCPECGRNLCATHWINKDGREYNAYRCRHKQYRLCSYASQPAEKKTEKFLLNNLKERIVEEIAKSELEKTQPKPKPKINVSALKEQLRRLNVMYMAGNKSDDEYQAESAKINALIAKAQEEAPPPERDLTRLKKLLEIDIKAMYNTLPIEEKQRFWRSLVKEIVVEKTEVKDIIFF